jgi:hypothetical protein
MTPDGQEEMVLEGVLLPIGRNHSDEPGAIVMMTFDEQEYPLDPSVVRHHHLRGLLRQPVRIVATLRGRLVDRVSEVVRLDGPGRR